MKQKKKITYCEICNKETKWGGKTCSREHANELKKKNNREKRCCSFCKKEFEVKKNSSKKLCSEKCRKDWAKLPENKENRIKKSQKSIKEKYNGKFFFETEEFQNKTKSTKRNKYGDENYNNINKAKSTKKEKYGNENYNNVNKSKSTKKEKYGDENYNNREKAKKTMKEIFGVSHAMKLEKFQNKYKKTLLEKYNCEFPLQNKGIKEKTILTNIEKYGVPYPTQSIDVKNKIRNNWKEKSGGTKYYSLYKSLECYDLKLIGKYIGYKTPKEERVGGDSYIEYDFNCLKCGNDFNSTFANYTIPKCPKCFPLSKFSNFHEEFTNFLNENSIKFKSNNKSIINPFEIDIIIKDTNIAIELNGNYWHSELGGGKNRSYHLNKSELCENKKYKLIHIFEDEWILKKEIVKSRILNLIKKSNKKIYARKCTIKPIEEKIKINFLNKNHIQGDVKGSKIKIGLYYKKELVSIMTFSKKRMVLGNKNNENEWEMTRFCSSLNTSVIGGFEKLLKYFIKNNNPKKIITYADCRWSGINHENTVYHKSNFKFIKKTVPNYFYFKKNDYIKRYNRYNFAKHKISKLLNEKNSKNLSEWQIAKKLGMDRIWDCGTLKYEMTLK